jgi:UDP-N-acetyl-D-glucosamine dehydrogenase
MMVNDRMPEYTVERAGKILNRFKRALNGSHILILGVAYKQDIDDYRESPAIRVIEEFKKTGAEVEFYDPYITEFKHKENSMTGLSELNAEKLNTVDLIVVTTAHTNVDYDFVQQNAVFVFDTKNAMKNVKQRENIELI